MLHSSPIAAVLLFCSLSPSAAAEDPLERAERLLAEKRFESAMDLLELLPLDRGRSGLQKRLLGSAYLEFALERLASGQTDVGLYFVDAARRFAEAHEAGCRSHELHRDWARALHQDSRFGEALSQSRRALATLPANLPAHEAAAIYRLHARISLQVASARGTLLPADSDESKAMRAAARAAVTLAPEDRPSRELLARVERWGGAPLAALDTLEFLLERDPERSELWEEWRATALGDPRGREQLPSRAAALARTLDSPLARWHQGLSELRLADALRSENAYALARDAYERSRELFDAVRDAAPGYQDASTFYLAQALAGVGWCEYFEERRKDAATWFLRSLETRPDHARTEDSLGLTPVRGIEAIASRYVADSFDESEPERLARLQLQARTLVERAIVHVPDHPEWRNNLGFLYREAGTRAEERGESDLAHEFFETSYAHYKRAVELAPLDARIVNDTALMLVYHLHRKLEEAERLLLEAVRLARADIAAIDRGESPGVARTKDELLEAGGDALQNLGYLYLVHQHDEDRARSFFEAVLTFDPVRPRNAQVRQFLAQLEKFP